jgi:hypothetical protein
MVRVLLPSLAGDFVPLKASNYQDNAESFLLPLRLFSFFFHFANRAQTTLADFFFNVRSTPRGSSESPFVETDISWILHRLEAIKFRTAIVSNADSLSAMKTRVIIILIVLYDDILPSSLSP